MSEDGQYNCLQSLDRKLANGKDLTIRQDIEVRNDDLPDVIDTTHIDKGSLYEATHGESVDLRQDLAFGGDACIWVGEHR